ncbi:MAG: UDP-N-acetylglucosamine 2-epimerase (non-hydrolyzing), partial [Bacteroidales bacterium]|nr:UDP-N-acetylglucosamine 2-epimerase (non-hydrolyzing) [Bacteroidales bacterium]
MKIATIVGARPQFVKAAVLSRLISQHSDMEEIMIHTGQHYDDNMSAIFFEELAIPQPRYNLNIHQLTHGAMTGRMMEEIEKVLLLETPDWVIVYGDTNSTLAGALAAKKLHIPVAHVEAGLRSYNMAMPEEINRILTDRISDLLFCPTQQAVDNLKKEGFDHFKNTIVLSGDVMLDAILYNADKWQKPAVKLPEKYLLCTVHRAENVNDTLQLK